MKNVIERRKRPDWDAFYLAQAFVVSGRAFDPRTQHGCVIVSKDNRLLSSGCNGPLKGSIDDEVPITSPEKYPFMIHAEENAILFYSGSKSDIEGATAYVTGRPCHRCLRMLLQKEVKRIVYANITSKCVDHEDLAHQEKLIELKKDKDVEIVLYDDKEKILEVLQDRVKYLQERVS